MAKQGCQLSHASLVNIVGVLDPTDLLIAESREERHGLQHSGIGWWIVTYIREVVIEVKFSEQFFDPNDICCVKTCLVRPQHLCRICDSQVL